MYVRSFIKNYQKGEKTIQILNVIVYDDNDKYILVKHYYLNVSKEKNTAYLSDIKD